MRQGPMLGAQLGGGVGNRAVYRGNRVQRAAKWGKINYSNIFVFNNFLNYVEGKQNIQ